MNILLKIEKLQERFDHYSGNIVSRQQEIKRLQETANNAIQQLSEEIIEITSEMNRLQGEHRVLVELGVEEGLLNEDGSLVTVEDTESVETVQSED